MKVFFKKISILLLVLLATFIIVDALSFAGIFRRYIGYFTDSYELLGTGPEQIVPNILKARCEDETTVLLVGDSVFSQMFSGLQEINPNISVIGSNGGIAPTGQYIIIREYLEHHPNAKEVYLFQLPISLMRGFDTDLGYQYAVAPFVETDTLKYLNEGTIDIIKQTYGKLSVNRTFEHLVDDSGINKKLYLNYLKDYRTPIVWDNPFNLADEYITGIKEMCKERNVDFYLISSPVSDRFIESAEEWKRDIEETNITKLFPNYMNDVLYFPDEESVDGTHFGGDYASQACYNNKIRAIISDTTLVDEIDLGD